MPKQCSLPLFYAFAPGLSTPPRHATPDYSLESEGRERKDNFFTL